MVACFFFIFYVFDKDKKLFFCCIILVSHIANKIFWVSEFFWNIEMMKTDKLGKRKYFSFIFFVFLNILIVKMMPWKLRLEFKFCCFYIFAWKDIALFTFFTKMQVLLFYGFFVSRLFQVYLYYYFIIFWTKCIFWKIIIFMIGA